MPVITPQDFMDSVFGAFDTYWAGRTVIAWPNKPFNPADLEVAESAAYVAPSLVYQAEGERQITTSVDPHLFFVEGTFQLEIFTRGEGSTDRSNELVADALVFVRNPPSSISGAIFRRRGRFSLGFNGVWYQDNVTAAFLLFTDQAP